MQPQMGNTSNICLQSHITNIFNICLLTLKHSQIMVWIILDKFKLKPRDIKNV